MKADRLGLLSAMLASICCVGPILLVLVGLGSLGVGALLSRYHWWFIGAAMLLLSVAWRSYLKEAAHCRATSCQMARGKTTRTVLTMASLVVAIFVGLNLATYASHSRQPGARIVSSGHGRLASVVIPVEGMTCFTCERTVEATLKGLPGVRSADAKVKDAAAYVQYDAAQVSLDELIAAINKTGYRAGPPQEDGGHGNERRNLL